MIDSNKYSSHVAINKELKMNEDFIKVREPYKDDFEKIREEAKENNINISNAKEFLNSLSKEELSTLQNYTRLADEINVGQLNDEGAYNLLLHHYEKFDFNGDGFISDGIGKTMSMIPVNMPDNEKKALVQTLNEMDPRDSFLTLALLNPPKFEFRNGEFIAVSNNETFDFNKIMERIEQILNPEPLGYSSPEIKNTYSIFKELFEKNFDDIKNKNQTVQNDLTNNSQILKAKIQA